jgi:hypothetical protein
LRRTHDDTVILRLVFFGFTHRLDYGLFSLHSPMKGNGASRFLFYVVCIVEKTCA